MANLVIPYFLIFPMGAGLLVPFVGRVQRFISELLTFFITMVLFLLAIFLLGKTGSHPVGGWRGPYGITLALDSLSLMMFLLVNGIGFIVSIFSFQYLERYTGKSNYYGLFLLLLAGMNGVVLTRDLFNLFIFLELTSISSYVLVAFGLKAEELEAGFKYLLLSSLGSIFILFGVALFYLNYGTVNMFQLSHQLWLNKGANNFNLLALLLLVAGFGIKGGLVPFHSWLADAHPSAPAPISAMLSGLVIKVLGVYVLIRFLFNIYGFDPHLNYLLVTLGLLSMIIGVLLAIVQWDYKRLLAYHSISQMGYIILSLGLGTPLGIMAGIYHLLNHSVFKSLLFLSSGAVEFGTGTRNLREMGGLREKMPISSAASLTGALAISGVPPFNGFFSKLMIIFACISAGRWVLGIIAVLVSILTLASFTKVQRWAFFGMPKEKWQNLKEVPLSMQIAMIILMLTCLGLSLLILPEAREFLNYARVLQNWGELRMGPGG